MGFATAATAAAAVETAQRSSALGWPVQLGRPDPLAGFASGLGDAAATAAVRLRGDGTQGWLTGSRDARIVNLSFAVTATVACRHLRKTLAGGL